MIKHRASFSVNFIQFSETFNSSRSNQKFCNGALESWCAVCIKDYGVIILKNIDKQKTLEDKYMILSDMVCWAGPSKKEKRKEKKEGSICMDR